MMLVMMVVVVMTMMMALIPIFAISRLQVWVLLLLLVLLVFFLEHICPNGSRHDTSERAQHAAADLVAQEPAARTAEQRRAKSLLAVLSRSVHSDTYLLFLPVGRRGVPPVVLRVWRLCAIWYR